MLIYRTIIALILICISLSVLHYYQISQDVCYIGDAPMWQFVVWKTGKYCYIRGQQPNHLKIDKDFHTLRECEEYLSLYR